ncbi:phage head-tail connector protein [Planococcus halocryophilus]|uniref:phage head-tail connector protein n=1 Tax=Planococcus halocryophilus TaxID=1215089 RepID=UPI001F0DFF79|nr:phage head-tail connector protein [Planococcus halocryophilus]MCH4825784.1 phage head-tail connector protein [Planococcus halocryophilus]
MLDRVKRILGLSLVAETSSDDFLLEQFIDMYSNALILEINESIIPASLEFILIEAVVSRWNRRGLEGLKSESVDIVSHTFNEDHFSSNRQFIEAYKANMKLINQTNRIRFL